MNYKDLFDEKAKAAAFDKIASNYYECNFGTMPKTELELLMFSIYADQVLANDKSGLENYSDYRLSKALGITQQRISGLKIKKQLKYPVENFNWVSEFYKITGNARYEDGKIKIYIPDPNVYIELKNFIESKGGYVDISLNPKLLQIPPEYFLWLLLEICPEEKKDGLEKAIREQFRKSKVDVEDFAPMTFKKLLKEKGPELLGDVAEASIPVVGGLIGNVIKTVSGSAKK
ncbi:MAG: hypothetical protein K6A42_11640 [Treponema sp.]|nr:hypothetical protein [Treponema sp.]